MQLDGTTVAILVSDLFEQDDIRNAGGCWVDRELVVDGNWISSRKPAVLPAFNRELIAAIAQQAMRPAKAAEHA